MGHSGAVLHDTGERDREAQANRAYDVVALARLWNCSRYSVREEIRKGNLRHVRIGRLVRIPESAVTEFLARKASTT
jgi:excisionase family DNA binding protein